MACSQSEGRRDAPLEVEAARNVARQLLKADALKAEIGIAGVASLEAKYEGEYAGIMANQGELVRRKDQVTRFRPIALMINRRRRGP